MLLHNKLSFAVGPRPLSLYECRDLDNAGVTFFPDGVFDDLTSLTEL